MIDGIQFTFHTPDARSHILSLPFWEVLINEESGKKVNELRTANFRAIDLKLKLAQVGGYFLFANGSLHKYYNCGIHNADQFTFEKLTESIHGFTTTLGIDPKECEIHGLEIGVNLELSHTPLRMLKNVVSYGSKGFTAINKRNARKGLQCSLKQYAVKIYDKGEQSDISDINVIRFEVSVSKMQVIKVHDIITLADLQVKDKVFSLVRELQKAAKNIIWTDSTVNLRPLTSREQKQWLSFSNPLIWARMSKHTRTRAVRSWEILLNKYGEKPDLISAINNAWSKLFEAENVQPFYQLESKSEANKIATFLPLECTVKRLNTFTKLLPFNKTTFPRRKSKSISDKNPSANTLSKCLSCGKLLINQRKLSRFCSERLYGTKGKSCRNKHSNKKRKIRRQLEVMMRSSNFISITYHDRMMIEFSDILHTSEVDIKSEWLNRIVSIKPVIKQK